MINYAEIIENLRDEDVFHLLESLGGEPIDKDEYILSRTICHHEDPSEGNYKLYYYKNTHLFYCYSSCGSMSIFKFLQHYYEIRQIEYDWYNDILQVILNCAATVTVGTTAYRSQADNYRPQKTRKELPTYPEGLLEIYNKYYPIEWLKDSITTRAMDKYNILFSHSQNKIIIPHYNIHGELVGIRGRALNEWEVENIGKYAPVWIEGKCYSHPLSLNLYGLNKTWENIKRTSTAFVVEGEKSCLQAENFSMLNCTCAACGSNLNKYQLDILLRYCRPKEVVLCFDKEELPHQDVYFNKLYNICKKYSMYTNMSFIYDRNNLLNLKESPFDRGEEIFQNLLKSRIKI